MISFLVKLANLLDDRGQHEMAREVDGLIEKLAQQVMSPEQLIQRYQEAERANQQAAADWQAAQKAWQQRPGNEELLAKRDEAKKHYDATWSARDQAKKELDADSARMSPSKAPAQQTGVATKEIAKKPAKAPAKTNPLVAQIQKDLGVKQSGRWDSATNKAFIAAMNSQPEYAKMMSGGKFQGTLQQAAQMIGQLAFLNQPAPSTGVASKESAASPTPVVKQEDDAEVPPRNGPFGGPEFYGR